MMTDTDFKLMLYIFHTKIIFLFSTLTINIVNRQSNLKNKFPVCINNITALIFNESVLY